MSVLICALPYDTDVSGLPEADEPGHVVVPAMVQRAHHIGTGDDGEPRYALLPADRRLITVTAPQEQVAEWLRG